MKRILIGAGVLAFVGAIAVATFLWRQAGAAADPAYFESEILVFEESDALDMPTPGGIVFVGSSSIRLWKTLADDMAPLPVVRRGFGGAHMTHVLHNAGRIITPYAPRAIVVFVGGNDIASGKSAERVIADFDSFLEMMRRDLPQADIWLLSMKPSKFRWKQWDDLKRLSTGLAELAAADPRVRFVETGLSLLGPDGTPDDVYVFDGLHLNAEGYQRWTNVLKPLLMDAYEIPASRDL